MNKQISVQGPKDALYKGDAQISHEGDNFFYKGDAL